MKKKILIIDDDLDMCSLLSRFLNKKGFETEMAHNGAKGLAKFTQREKYCGDEAAKQYVFPLNLSIGQYLKHKRK